MKHIKFLIILLIGCSIHANDELAKQIFRTLRDSSKNEQQKANEVKNLINAGANVNFKSPDIPNFTPLMLAADLGQLASVKVLLDNKASVNDVDNLGSTALFWAARKGHLNIVELLLSKGAKLDTINKQGNNILLDILRAYGANLGAAKDKEQFKKNIARIIELLIDKGANVKAKGTVAETGRTPILWAAFWKNFDLIKLLIRKGANICDKDAAGNTIAYYMPDPKHDKSLTRAEIDVIKSIKSVHLEECEWGEL